MAITMSLFCRIKSKIMKPEIEIGDTVFLETFNDKISSIKAVTVTYVGNNNMKVDNILTLFSIDTGFHASTTFRYRIWFTIKEYKESKGESMVRARLAYKRIKIHQLPIEKVLQILRIIEE